MATAFDTFRFPSQFDKFVPYTPPSQKVNAPQQRVLQEAEPISEEWPDIDKMLEKPSEDAVAMDDTQSLVPILDLTSFGQLEDPDNEAVLTDGDLPKGRQVRQLSQEEHVQSPDDSRMGTMPDHSSAGDSPEHPLVLDGDTDDEYESGDTADDVESISGAPEHEINASLSITDGHTNGSTAVGVSSGREQRLSSLERERATGRDGMFGHESQSGTSSLQRKRKRSKSLGTDERHIEQTPSLMRARHDEDAYSAKRFKRQSSTSLDSATNVTLHAGFAPSWPGNDPRADNGNEESTVNMFDSKGGSENGGTDNGCSGERANDAQGEVGETNAAALNGFRTLQAGPIRQGPSKRSPPSEQVETKGTPQEANPKGVTYIDGERSTTKPDRERTLSISPDVVQPTKQHRSLPLPRAVRTNSKAGHDRKRARFAESPPRSAVPSRLPHGRPSARGVKLPSGPINGGLFPDAPQKLVHSTIRRILPELSFFTTIIEDNRTMPAFSYDLSMALIERAMGYSGHIEALTILPLALDSWLITGFLNEQHSTSRLGIDRKATRSSGIATSLSLYSLRTKAVNTTHYQSAHGEQSSDEDSSSDGAGFISEEEYSSEEDGRLSVKGKKNRWEASEEAHLEKYMRDKWKWSDIFAQFPHRTQGAVRLRGHMLRQRAEKSSR